MKIKNTFNNIKNNSINVLNLSKITNIVLHNHHIDNLYQLLSIEDSVIEKWFPYDDEILDTINNAFTELLHPHELCRDSNDPSIYQILFSNVSNEDIVTFKYNGIEYNDLLVYEVIEIPTKVINVAQRLNINTLKSILAYSHNKLINFPQFGKSSYDTLVDFLTQLCVISRPLRNLPVIVNKNIPKDITDDYISLEDYSYLSQITTILYDDLQHSVDYSTIQSIIYTNKNLILSFKSESIENICNNSTVIDILYENDIVIEGITKLICNTLYKYQNGLPKFKLLNKLPKSFINCTKVNELFTQIYESCDTINFFNGVYLYKFESILQYIYSYVPDKYIEESCVQRAKEIASKFLKGLTYRQLAKVYDISYQRIGQLVGKMISRRPPVFEDRYIYWFNTYDIPEKLFYKIFNVPTYVYRYVKLVNSYSNKDIESDKKPYKEMLHDSLLDKNAYNEVFKLTIHNNDKRNAKVVNLWKLFVDKYKITYNQTPVSIDTVCKDYYEFSESLDIDESNRSVHAIYSHLLNHDSHFISCRKNLFRYYEITDEEATKLLEALSLDKYMNKCISSYKLYVDNPIIMNQYDIRSEYELYSIIKMYKKLLSIKIECKRMPLISIGNNVDRYKQTYNELIKLTPCTRAVLVNRLHELYGLDKVTTIAYWLKPLENYYNNGVYVLNS